MTDEIFDIKKPTSKEERTNKDLIALAKNIAPLTKSVFGKKGFMEIDILTNWDKIVGTDLASYSFPQKIDFKRDQKNNGILHLCVPGGAFALEIQHREKTILEKINTYFGYNAVCGLKIVQNSALCLEENDEYSYTPPPIVVTADEKNYINNLTEDIKSSKLKEILIKLGQSIFSNNHKENEKNEI